MKRFPLLLIISLIHVSVYSQSTLKQDKEAIKSMCGCYSITFDYAETFPHVDGYKIRDPYHTGASAEWIFVEEETDDKIVIQHLLVISDSMIVKHWRQDWLYENRDLYQFHKDMSWHSNRLPKKEVEGQWTQKVYQVDDSPRYEGTATWIHEDGKHYWESVADAPLPRREFTKRDDYNVMQRRNRHILTDYGWLHEQDNLKIVRENGNDTVIVEEKGLNKYTRIDDKHCEPAIAWWEKNRDYWKLVRSEWDNIFDRRQDLHLIKEADDNLLWEALFALGDEMAPHSESEPELVSAKIEKVIQSYITDRAKNVNAAY